MAYIRGFISGGLIFESNSQEPYFREGDYIRGHISKGYITITI